MGHLVTQEFASEQVREIGFADLKVVFGQRCVDRGKEINLTAAVNKDIITRGLRYSLATGNWGIQGGDVRAGVSQVCSHPLRLLVCLERVWHV
jgi:DNA-directed RNA polymerase beta subunit